MYTSLHKYSPQVVTLSWDYKVSTVKQEYLSCTQSSLDIFLTAFLTILDSSGYVKQLAQLKKMKGSKSNTSMSIPTIGNEDSQTLPT